MAKFITPRVSPYPVTTAASRQDREATTDRIVRQAALAPNPASTSAAAQIRRPVIPAAVTSPNSFPARPAPIWTLTMPMPSSTGGGTNRSAPGPRGASPQAGVSGRCDGTCPAVLLPAEDTRRDKDSGYRPPGQHKQVAGRQAAAVPEHRTQAVGHRAGRQRAQHRPHRSGKLGQREDHAADSQQDQVDQ